MLKEVMHERVSELDPAVLNRARQGDHAAFRDLVRHHDAGLRALAFRLLGDAARMDDVLQEAYVKAYRGLASFRGESSVRTWLYRITYNACLDDMRRRSRVTDMPMQSVADRAASGPDPGERAVLRSGLSAALSLLPPDQRAAVLLVDAEGFDYAAAAGVLGVAEGTVASRASRARATLRAALRSSGEENR
jgi:RNA polymerase sigma-70 factor (ECF subfamily)